MMKVGSKVRVRLTSEYSYQRKFGIGVVIDRTRDWSHPIVVRFKGVIQRYYRSSDLESADFNDYIKAI